MTAFDFLGLKKDLAPAPERPAPGLPESAPKGSGLSPKAWVGLAAADLLLAAACGTVLFMRLGAHPEPQAKAVAAKPAPKAAEKPVEPAKPAEPPKPAEPAPKPEPAKAAPAKAPEPAKTAKAEPSKVPLGSPSVHAAPPPQRQATPKGAGPEAAAKKSQTRPVPFSHTDADAKEVNLMGPFLVRSGGRKMMFKDSKGVWTTTVYLNVGQTYKYRFEVAGPKGKRLTPYEKVEVLDGP